MGTWFTRFFTALGYPVHVADLDTELSVEEVARRCPVVIVSVPIGVTCEVIERIGPYVRKDGALMDLTSVKVKTVAAMLTHSQAEVVGVHPLFGPDVSDINGQNVILCPGRGETWRRWIKDILTQVGATVTETTSERHDYMMALVQGVNHLDTMLMGLTVKGTGITREELFPFSTPVFRVKWELVERLFSHPPVLYAEMLVHNPFLLPLLARYQECMGIMRACIEQGDVVGLVDLLTRYVTGTVPSINDGDGGRPPIGYGDR